MQSYRDNKLNLGGTNENLYIIIDTEGHDNSQATVKITIDGTSYKFDQGYMGTDYIHPTNGIMPIKKGSVFIVTFGGCNAYKVYMTY